MFREYLDMLKFRHYVVNSFFVFYIRQLCFLVTTSFQSSCFCQEFGFIFTHSSTSLYEASNFLHFFDNTEVNCYCQLISWTKTILPYNAPTNVHNSKTKLDCRNGELWNKRVAFRIKPNRFLEATRFRKIDERDLHNRKKV